MNTKLYVLGAVLGAAPGLLPGVTPPPAAKDALETQGTVPDEGRTRGGGQDQAPRHPCEAITIIQVPCDAEQEACEYTYWHCPEVVNPLRA
ncbi:hypothetical protein HV824_28155 [Myxococcus sp. AM009]|uniref:hypothetical protein n=1 Tax=unclassified Myxococcus TaxID=2648731 RepID=UPI0015963C57|nr:MULTISPECIES: hypothetical protein [unclassified Myxococcus]NVJ01974.1 hypothetical protein [Myxococcus sp. AM009]NVJ16309.1 hypothetical protein [Myxococcus sp. AM010]